MNAPIQTLLEAGITVADYPDLRVANGQTFVPRAILTGRDGSLTALCLVPPDDPETALTHDITLCRLIPNIAVAIHFDPYRGIALVGVPNSEGFRYCLTKDIVAFGGLRLSVDALRECCPATEKSRRNDLPLSGENLPQFTDIESFLSWWDFMPGKQRFEMIAGQGVLIPRLSYSSDDRRHVIHALRQHLGDDLTVITDMLFRADATTALHLPIAICRKPLAGGSFVEPLAVLFIGHHETEQKTMLARAATLNSHAIPCAVFNDNTGTWVSHDGSELMLIDLPTGPIPTRALLINDALSTR